MPFIIICPLSCSLLFMSSLITMFCMSIALSLNCTLYLTVICFPCLCWNTHGWAPQNTGGENNSTTVTQIVTLSSIQTSVQLLYVLDLLSAIFSTQTYEYKKLSHQQKLPFCPLSQHVTTPTSFKKTSQHPATKLMYLPASAFFYSETNVPYTT